MATGKINQKFDEATMYRIGVVRKGDPTSKPTYIGQPITLDGKTLKENGIGTPRELFTENRLGLDSKKPWRVYQLDEAGKETFVAEGTPVSRPAAGLADFPVSSAAGGGTSGNSSPYREFNDTLKSENADLRSQNSQLIGTVSQVLQQNSEMMAQLQQLSTERIQAERLAIQAEARLNEEIKLNGLKAATDKEIMELQQKFAKEKEGLAGLGLIETALPHFMPVIANWLGNLLGQNQPSVPPQPGPPLQDSAVQRYQQTKQNLPGNGRVNVQEF